MDRSVPLPAAGAGSASIRAWSANEHRATFPFGPGHDDNDSVADKSSPHRDAVRWWPGGRHTTSVKASVAQFAISGVAALVLVGVIGAIVLDRIGTSEAIREARQITRILGRGVIEPHLSEGLVRGDDKAVAALDRIVRARVLNDPVVRVKLWTRGGRVVYSDEPRQIGSTYPWTRSSMSG